MRGIQVRKKLKKGLNTIVPEGKMRFLSLDLLLLDGAKKHSGKSGKNELGLVVLSGRCSVRVGEDEYSQVGNRKNVFTGKGAAVYIPPMSDFSILAEKDTELAICRSKANRKGTPFLVRPKEVKEKMVGRGNWQRKVHDIIHERSPAQRLVLGETFNRSGGWSSWPPHKHDVHNPPHEALMEEIYFFKVRPEQGFGMQRIYDNKSMDLTLTVKNNDAIMIHRGYHPVVATPGYQLYYLWFLAGRGRKLIPRDDPDHGWVKEKK